MSMLYRCQIYKKVGMNSGIRWEGTLGKKAENYCFMVLWWWQSHCKCSPSSIAGWAPGSWLSALKPSQLVVPWVRHLLVLLNLEADTHFTVPQRVEGWVDLGTAFCVHCAASAQSCTSECLSAPLKSLTFWRYANQIIIIIIIFFDPGTSFPRYGILSKCEMSGMATMETQKLRRCWTGRPH